MTAVDTKAPTEVGNVTYWVLITSTLGRLWPGVFGEGDTVAAVLLGSAGLWT